MSDRGLDEARYGRPAAIILAVTVEPSGASHILLLPLTTREPQAGREALLVPPGVRRRLGLDAERSWIMLDEANEFVWPGHDLEQNPDGRFEYGVLPPALFEQARVRVLALLRAGHLRRTWRQG